MNLRAIPCRYAIYVAAAIACVIRICLCEPVICNDTNSYLDAWHHISTTLSPDTLRTPLYPLILGICGGATRTLVGLQYAVNLLSLPSVWRTMRLLGTGNAPATAGLLIYAAAIICTDTNNMILTEPLAIAGTVFIIRFTVEAYKEDSPRAALMSGAVCLLMVSLKPVFLSMPPLLLIFWLTAILRRKASRRAAISGTGAALAAMLLCGAYISEIRRLTDGVNSPSTVSVINGYTTTVQARLLDPDMLTQPDSKIRLTRLYKSNPGKGLIDSHCVWDSYYYISAREDMATLDSAITASVAQHPWRWLESVARRAGHAFASDVFTAAMMLIAAAYPLLLTLWQRKRLTLCGISIWAMLTVNILVNIAGAPDSFSRLLTPSSPAAFLLLMQMLPSATGRQDLY